MGVQACPTGGAWGPCGCEACGAEVCDGLDNDCDGMTDCDDTEDCAATPECVALADPDEDGLPTMVEALLGTAPDDDDTDDDGFGDPTAPETENIETVDVVYTGNPTGGEVEGEFGGFAPDGALMLNVDGEERRFAAGELVGPLSADGG